VIRWTRTRACALVAATATAAAVVMAGTLPHAGADEGLVESAEWRPFPKDTVGHGFVAVDDVARVGFAFSGTADVGAWTRVQAIDVDSGRPLSAVTPTRVVSTRAPVLVDVKRHVVVYAETHARNTTGPVSSYLVGLALRGREVKEIFRVTSPVGANRIAGMSFDDAGDDLVVVGTADGAGQNLVQGSSVVEVQRVAVSGLLANTLQTRWADPFSLPKGACPTLIQTAQPAGVLVAGDRVYVACRPASTAGTGTTGQTLMSSAVVQVSGLGAKRAASPVTRQFRTPGNFTIGGESLADPHTRRFVIVESSGYIGLRVFDADHGRYVGRINAGQQSLYGATLDTHTSRVYFASFDPTVGVGFGDLAARVPTQGERVPDPYSAYIGKGTQRRLSFDASARRLLVPLRRTDDSGHDVESILVFTDKSEPYRDPAPIDHALGSIDAVDKAGVTDSSVVTVARAYGTDYQLIGGTANLLQNVTGVDTRGIARPGTRHLRQAYVRSASLTGDGAVAATTTAEEDPTTDADRHSGTAPSPAPSSATAGSSFAPMAECSDYGAGKNDATAPHARSACDLLGEAVTGDAQFLADDGVLVTTPAIAQTSPVPAPIQTGRSTTTVVERRMPNRGPVVTTVTSTAENVAIAGVATFGRIVQVVTLTAHGRTGTAKIDRKVTIANVVVQGKDVCGSQCDPAVVQQQVNAALDGRGGIEFPAPALTVAPRGTYAELTQDPWYHAERVLDFDKANDDFVVPAMSVQLWMDSTSKSRLVVELAGVSASVSYRVYPLGDDSYDDGSDDVGDEDDVVQPGPVASNAPRIVAKPTASGPSQPPPPALANDTDGGFVTGLVDRLTLSLRSLGDALPLLLIWALLGIPAYLSARRRLLLELPMLTRDEELT